MIITESFVWINYPRCGSTFVRKALRRLYTVSGRGLLKRWRMRGRWMREEMCPHLRFLPTTARYGAATPHGTVAQIPPAYRHLPIASSVRDPFDRLVSLYAYGDWKRPETYPCSEDALAERFPGFPDLTFAQYLDYIPVTAGDAGLTVNGQRHPLGPLSADFLKFFLRSWEPGAREFRFQSIPELREDLADVRYLCCERLNLDLHEFLLRLGYPRADTAFIPPAEKINASGRDVGESYWTPEMKAQIRERECLLFALMREVETGEKVLEHVLRSPDGGDSDDTRHPVAARTGDLRR